MIRPGEESRQGYPTDELGSHDDATMRDARDILTRHAHDDEPIASTVVYMIDLRKGDLFFHDSGPAEAIDSQFVDEYDAEPAWVARVTSSKAFFPGVKLVNAEHLPETEDAHEVELSEFFEGGYVRLFRDWLRGDLVPVDRERRFFRADTGEEVDPRQPV